MLAVVLAILTKLVVILKLGLRSVSKRIKSFIFFIFKHLHSTAICFDSYNSLCFKIIDKTNSKFDLKVTEALHINWGKPNLNAQQNHLALTLFTIASVPRAPFCLCLFFFCCFFAILFHLLFLLSLR